MTLPPLVLVVEDDPDIRDLEAEVLAMRGYRVATAGHGEEALRRIADEEPALILLDMRMPVMDGWAFARRMRERHGRRIPVVVVTAGEDAARRAAEIDADAGLGKPFDLDELYAVVAGAAGTP